jgi:hypothetical protein
MHVLASLSGGLLSGCALPVGFSGTTSWAYDHPAILDHEGSVGRRLQLMLHPSGSRGLAVGAEGAWPFGGGCATTSGATPAATLGWSFMPLPDESRAGGEFTSLFGYGGIGRPSYCVHGWFAGGRVGIPLRISPSQPPFELDRVGGPTVYLVPQFELSRYFTPERHEDRSAWQLAAMLGVRVFFWSRLEP